MGISQIDKHVAEKLQQAQEDLLFDDVDTSDAPWIDPPTDEPIPFTLWEVLAYDLAFGYAPEGDICDAYNICDNQLQDLKNNDHFLKILESKKREIQQLGSDADFAIQFRMIAQKGLKMFLKRMTSSNISDRDFLNMFKVATEYAQLNPETGGSDNDKPPVIGGNAGMVFNIYGIPGLEHLSDADAPTNIIEHQPTEDVKTIEGPEKVEVINSPQEVSFLDIEIEDI